MKALLVLCTLMCALNSFAQEGTEIIEHIGDRYIINVNALKPDKEMTLMDVLLTCPELMSANGKRLSDDYEIRIDNVVLQMDDEMVLEALKANEISTIEIYLSTSVSIGGGGRFGTIDIYLKEQPAATTSGKLMLEGSTRGNGKAYADIVSRTGDITLRGYALANLRYTRGSLIEYDWFSSRQGVENVHLNMNWDISERDNLKAKLSQYYIDAKHRLRNGTDPTLTMDERQRCWEGVVNYTRTLNDQGATLLAEGGFNYQNNSIEGARFQDCFAYYFTEANIPLNNSLSLLAGWEIDYDNLLTTGYDRQQTMFNDLYVQFDYAHGPWVMALGDRFRFINYWHRLYNLGYGSLWNNSRTEHSYLASVGYKTGGHFVQGLFSRDYTTPVIYNFMDGSDDNEQSMAYRTRFNTCMVYNTEARYTYQQEDLVMSGSLLHTWEDNNAAFDERYTGFRASATWRRGCLRLTAGADYFYGEATNAENDIKRHCHFFHLRLLPTLLLGGGLRISSRLLYSSHNDLIIDMPAHLYASVKVSKDLGSHCTLYADFHDLAGAPKLSFMQVGTSYDSRALTLGLTYRF